MRPVSRGDPPEPKNIRSPDDPFDLWQYTLRCADGTQVKSAIRIFAFTVEQMARNRDACGPGVADGVDSKGWTVIRDNVLQKEDPRLNWAICRRSPELPQS